MRFLSANHFLAVCDCKNTKKISIDKKNFASAPEIHGGKVWFVFFCVMGQWLRPATKILRTRLALKEK